MFSFLLKSAASVLCVLEGMRKKRILPERQVQEMYKNTGQYTRSDVISLLQEISFLANRIACSMQKAGAKEGGQKNVKDVRPRSYVG